MSDSFEIYIDGACHGNPGPAGIGVVILRKGNRIKEISKEIGLATNNIAEYSALICALEEALDLKAEALNIYTDSQLLYKQVTGQYKIKHENLIDLYHKAEELARHFRSVTIKHILRDKNKEADQLASRALKPKQAKVVASPFKDGGEESPSSKG